MNVSPASGALIVARRNRSRDPWRSFPAALLSGFLVLGAAAAGLRAQEPQAPISLFPPTVTAPQPDRVPTATQEPGPNLASPAETAAETPQYEGIEVDRLGELDPASLGILDLENGGLGPDTWTGSARRRIEALLRRLPDDPTSPTLRSLVTRLLLSSAKPPSGDAPAATAPTVEDVLAAAQAAQSGGSDFLRLRAERLYAMGELAGLNRLLSLVPQRVADPWLAEARVDGLLLATRDAEACELVPAGLARFPQALYWAKAQVFCQFVAQQTDRALLGLDLLREQAPDNDPAFFALADTFITGAPADLNGGALTPLTLAMLRNSGSVFAAETLDGVGPLLLHGIANLTRSDPAVRADAVERLVEVGALPGARLAGAYDAFEFTEAELGDAVSGAGRSDGPRGRALLYRAATREGLAATRAEILRAAFLSAEADGRSNAVARATLPLLTDLAPTPELAWFAPLAVRNLFRIGQLERAGAWLSVLRIDGFKHPESQAAYVALKPLLRLAGGGEPLAAAAGEEADPAAAERRLLLLVLSRALGQEESLPWIAPDAQQAVAAQVLPRLASLLAMGDAAAGGRRGETVLLCVAALGAAAPAGSHPLALGYALSALMAVGLGNEARALALEAALAART